MTVQESRRGDEAGNDPHRRGEVLWSPTVLEETCDGCGVCVDFCPREVYAFDEEREVAVVASPDRCIAGCSLCALRCERVAIRFPSKKILDSIRRSPGP